jgi:hypothetical protein
MAASPGGYASKAEQARRLAILRELWLTDRTAAVIGARLGISESTVSSLAREAGLPRRHRRHADSLDTQGSLDTLPPMS